MKPRRSDGTPGQKIGRTGKLIPNPGQTTSTKAEKLVRTAQSAAEQAHEPLHQVDQVVGPVTSQRRGVASWNAMTVAKGLRNGGVLGSIAMLITFAAGAATLPAVAPFVVGTGLAWATFALLRKGQNNIKVDQADVAPLKEQFENSPEERGMMAAALERALDRKYLQSIEPEAVKTLRDLISETPAEDRARAGLQLDVLELAAKPNSVSQKGAQELLEHFMKLPREDKAEVRQALYEMFFDGTHARRKMTPGTAADLYSAFASPETKEQHVDGLRALVDWSFQTRSPGGRRITDGEAARIVKAVMAAPASHREALQAALRDVLFFRQRDGKWQFRQEPYSDEARKMLSDTAFRTLTPDDPSAA
jgi:hypothetical protein